MKTLRNEGHKLRGDLLTLIATETDTIKLAEGIGKLITAYNDKLVGDFAELIQVYKYGKDISVRVENVKKGKGLLTADEMRKELFEKVEVEKINHAK